MIKKLLTIDNGNTNPHVGVFHDEELQEIISLSKLIEHIEKYEDYKAVISSVGKNLAHTNLDFIEIAPEKKKNQFIDMPVHYSETIGEDRLFQAYFIYKNFFHKDLASVLLIDAGTFLKADMIDKNGFQGGYIFPGVQTFLNSYARGQLLSVFEASDLNDKEYNLTKNPNTTKDAIVDACEVFLVESLKAIIRDKNPEVILVTGGHAQLINNLLKDKVDRPIIEDLNLIHYSLKEIANKIHTK